MDFCVAKYQLNRYSSKHGKNIRHCQGPEEAEV